MATGRRIVTSSLGRRSYARAPVSPLHLFDRQQDFAYQQEVAGSPSKRHHVRFWRCPDGWMLPGGYEADWLAAGTYDRSVGVSLFTFQVTHKIEQNTDVERDFIVETVTAADPLISVRVIRNFSTGYHSRNGGGDLIETDGDLPIVDLTGVDAPVEEAAAPTDSRDKRPAQTVFGAGVALLRGTAYLLLAIWLLISSADALLSLAGAEAVDVAGLSPRVLSRLTGVVLIIVAILDLGLGLAVLAGRNWARLFLMLVCVLSTITAFVANARGQQVVGLADLPVVGASVLVLLALSSHRARDYAARGRHIAKEVSAGNSGQHRHRRRPTTAVAENRASRPTPGCPPLARAGGESKGVFADAADSSWAPALHRPTAGLRRADHPVAEVEGQRWGNGGVYFVSSFARPEATGDGSLNAHDGQVWFYSPERRTISLVTDPWFRA